MAPDAGRKAADPAVVTAANVDLTNCDREMIQLSGAVQPHCALLVIEEPSLRILQASASTEPLFGLAAESLAGQPLSVLLDAGEEAELRAGTADRPLEAPVHLMRLERNGERFHLFAHRIDGFLMLELERSPGEADRPLQDLYAELRNHLAKLQQTPTLEASLQLVVQQVRQFTGFDRVLAYRFLPDLSGQVVAEAKTEEAEPYLGLRYPASDIPAPARRLFSMLWLRHLPDVNYTPSPLEPQLNPVTGQPADLSCVAGRSVSVMYSRYLRNMGVRATMVITLLKEDKVWGLISCMHHSGRRHIPYDVRVACEFLGHMVSLLMAAKEENEEKARMLALRERLGRLTDRLGKGDPFYQGLIGEESELLSLLDADGAAVTIGPSVHRFGNCPDDEQVRRIVAWLEMTAGEEGVYCTSGLSVEMEGAKAFRDTASGLLAVCLAKAAKIWVLWFRPEVSQTVVWAGNPAKPVETESVDGEVRLTPRGSFAAWKEEVTGRAREWTSYEIRTMGLLRQSVSEVIARRSEEMLWLNRELRISNIELDSFAYAASHDLKEPLRGIHNFSTLVLRQSGELMDPDSRARMKVIRKLAQRMDELIEALLHYSRIGRTPMQFRKTDLNQLLEDTREMLSGRFEETKTELRVPRPLPVAFCDPVRIREVFANLLSNALKFNDKGARWIEVGWQDSDPLRIWVEDNGIGIEPAQYENIFRIFRRLHGRDEWGGGSGAGLTIVRRIVERHGGEIRVESRPGEGTRFLFTLSQQAHETVPPPEVPF